MFNSPLPSVGFLFAFYATVAARIGKRTCRPNGIISITLSPVLYVFFYNQQVLWLRNRISHSSRFCLKKKKTNSVWNSDAADALHFQIVGILHVVQKALYFYLF